jgi:hypothetical protein
VNVVQQDAAAALVAPTSEQAFFSGSQYGFDCRLGIEYVHVTTSERDAVVALYRSRKGLRYLICEVQRPPDQVISQTQTIAGTLSYQVLNVNQPVFAAAWLLRWNNDLTCTYLTSPAINAAYGRSWFSCNGWLQPAGTSLPIRPMFTNMAIKSGNNNLVYQATIFDLLDDKSIRYFKNGAATVRGIPAISYAHRPTAANACTGSVDFSVVNQPIQFWQCNPTPPYATVALWAVQDIGTASDLVISSIYFTYNNIDVTNYDAIRMSSLVFDLVLFLSQVPSTESHARRSRARVWAGRRPGGPVAPATSACGAPDGVPGALALGGAQVPRLRHARGPLAGVETTALLRGAALDDAAGDRKAVAALHGRGQQSARCREQVLRLDRRRRAPYEVPKALARRVRPSSDLLSARRRRHRHYLLSATRAHRGALSRRRRLLCSRRADRVRAAAQSSSSWGRTEAGAIAFTLGGTCSSTTNLTGLT